MVQALTINHCLLLLNVDEVAISCHIFLLSIILLFCFLNLNKILRGRSKQSRVVVIRTFIIYIYIYIKLSNEAQMKCESGIQLPCLSSSKIAGKQIINIYMWKNNELFVSAAWSRRVAVYWMLRIATKCQDCECLSHILWWSLELLFIEVT